VYITIGNSLVALHFRCFHHFQPSSFVAFSSSSLQRRLTLLTHQISFKRLVRSESQPEVTHFLIWTVRLQSLKAELDHISIFELELFVCCFNRFSRLVDRLETITGIELVTLFPKASLSLLHLPN
jgi:hypothetical protein